MFMFGKANTVKKTEIVRCYPKFILQCILPETQP